MTMKSSGTVGILGGMGPAATIDLMQRILDRTPAGGDEDHIRMLVDNNPKVPSRIDYLIHGRGENPLPVIADMARSLQTQGADFLAMPCNTAHLFAEELSAAVSIPLVNMIEVTAAQTTEFDRIGLLASSAVTGAGLYENAISAEVIVPESQDQSVLMDVILAVKAGNLDDSHRNTFAELAGKIVEQGAQTLVVACTELSVIVSEMDLKVSVLDAADCLAEAVVREAQNE